MCYSTHSFQVFNVGYKAMRQLLRLMTIIACFLSSHTLVGGEVITFFVRAYPTGNAGVGAKPFNCALQQPGQMSEYCLQAGMPTTITSGIFFSYGGFLSISSLNGQVLFPRKHLEPELHLLITDKLTPIHRLKNTIDRWELETGTLAELYTIKRSWDNQARLFYWQVSKAQLPQNKQIPLTTIIMFAKPRHVYVPLGVTPTTGDPNLILPDIYVKTAIKAPGNSLYLLNLRPFFGPMGFLQQKSPLHQSFHLYDWGHEIR